MKKLTLALFAILFTAIGYASGTQFYLPYFDQGFDPAAQIDVRGDTPNIGMLITTEVGTGLFSGATQPEGVGVWASASNGATALKVQGDAEIFDGRLLKQREAGHILRIYDPATGQLIGVFEYSFE